MHYFHTLKESASIRPPRRLMQNGTITALCIFQTHLNEEAAAALTAKAPARERPIKISNCGDVPTFPQMGVLSDDYFITQTGLPPLLLITQLPQRRSREARRAHYLLIILHCSRREVRPGRNQLFHYIRVCMQFCVTPQVR
jgi:hypothetical protein